jgi:hypothetical protein
VKTPEAAEEQVGELLDQADVKLDRGCHSGRTRTVLAALGFTGEIARKGVPLRSGPASAGSWNGATRG